MVKQQIVLVLVALGVFLVAFVAFAYAGKFVDTRKQRVLTAKRQLVSYEENKKIFAEESIALKGLADRVDALEAKRVTSATTPELLSALEALAREMGVQFAITTVQAPDQLNKVSTLTITFSAQGSANALDMFMDALMHQEYAVRVTKLSLFADTTADATITTGANKASTTKTKPLSWSMLAAIDIVSFQP